MMLSICQPKRPLRVDLRLNFINLSAEQAPAGRLKAQFDHLLRFVLPSKSRFENDLATFCISDKFKSVHTFVETFEFIRSTNTRQNLSQKLDLLHI